MGTPFIDAGDAPGMLEKGELDAAVLLYEDEIYHEFKVQQFFGMPLAKSASRIAIDLVKYARAVGAFRSKPSSADVKTLAEFSRIWVQALYQAYKYAIPAGHVNTLRDVEGMQPADVPLSMMDLIDEVEEGLAGAVTQFVRVCLRTYEAFCIAVLTDTSLSVTVDGKSESLGNPFGLVSAVESTGWNTTSLNLFARWETLMGTFRKMAGGPPTDVMIGPDFYSDYIVDNDDVLPLLIRNPELVTRDLTNMLGANALGNTEDNRRFKVHIIDTQTEEIGGAATDMWSSKDMVWVRDPQRALRQYTVRTKDNDYNGGIGVYYAEPINPKEDEVYVSHNAVPAIKDPTKVMHIRLQT